MRKRERSVKARMSFQRTKLVPGRDGQFAAPIMARAMPRFRYDGLTSSP
jgi:hypothetical protein